MPNRIVREGILTSERVKRRSGVWPVAVRRRFIDADRRRREANRYNFDRF